MNLHEQGRKLIGEVENKEAVRILKQALAIEPLNPGISIDLGLAYFNLGDYRSAFEYWKKAEELVPENFDLLWNIGYLFEIEKNYKLAKDYYSRALNYARRANKLKKVEHYEEWVRKIEKRI